MAIRVKCNKTKLCSGARKAHMEPYDWTGLPLYKHYGKGYLLNVFILTTGDYDPTPIEFCPFCGERIKNLKP